jgi:hypothetical protein
MRIMCGPRDVGSPLPKRSQWPLLCLFYSLTRNTLAIPIQQQACFLWGPFISEHNYVVLCGCWNRMGRAVVALWFCSMGKIEFSHQYPSSSHTYVCGGRRRKWSTHTLPTPARRGGPSSIHGYSDEYPLFLWKYFMYIEYVWCVLGIRLIFSSWAWYVCSSRARYSSDQS